jgi:DNA-binding response OmpR family regulator
MILIADDDPVILSIVERMLSRRGWDVMLARDGIACVDLFHKNLGLINLVITNAAMPRMDGCRASRLIRSLDAQIPIVLMSGHSRALLETEDNLESISVFLAKPFTMDEMCTQVKTLLDGSAQRSDNA